MIWLLKIYEWKSLYGWFYKLIKKLSGMRYGEKKEKCTEITLNNRKYNARLSVCIYGNMAYNWLLHHLWLSKLMLGCLVTLNIVFDRIFKMQRLTSMNPLRKGDIWVSATSLKPVSQLWQSYNNLKSFTGAEREFSSSCL